MAKQTKVITRRRKFVEVDLPLIRSRVELIGNSPEDVEGRTIKLDLTRQLRGKSVEAVVKIKIEEGKAVASPIKIKLMPYFIRRMIRKRISYVEDSFDTPSQESMIRVKPFLITRKRVSRVVRKTLRNKARNWIEDYIAGKTNEEIFNDILSNKMQKSLSLVLKKTYPLSLCEIRVLEVGRDLEPEEVPEIKEVEIVEEREDEEGLDQMKEIEEQKIKEAEEEIKKAQERAVEVSGVEEKEVGGEGKEKIEEEGKEETIKEKPEKTLKVKKIPKVKKEVESKGEEK